MFTGIITDLGKLKKRSGSSFIFSAQVSFCKKLEKGTSVAINGVCLTVVTKPDQTSFSVNIMPETEVKTNLSQTKIGDIVNLELPATSSSFLSGHIVQGHVDGVGKITKITKDGNSKVFTISMSKNLTKQIIDKGSITVNGIALTVIKQVRNKITVGIIPYTWEHTMLYKTKIGDFVNIETDVLAKYVEKIMSAKGGSASG